MKKLLSLLIFCLIGICGWAESVDFSAQGYSNGQEISSYTGTDFTVTFDKGTNSNTPKYYNTGTAVRVYGGGYFTVSSEKTITKIELGFGSGDGSNAITTDVETYEGGIWEGSASSVTFTIGGTTGHRRIKTIEVTFDGDAPVITVTPPTFSPAAGEVNAGTEVTISAPDAEMIIYTTDDTDPSYENDNGEIYTAPIVVNTETTIKAIAVDEAGNESTVASATYTIKPEAVTCANIAEFNALPNNTEFTFTGELIVSAQKDSYLYAQDNDNGILIYGSVGQTYELLDVIPAGWKGKKTTFKGAPEATNLSDFAEAEIQGNLAPEEMTPAQVTLENSFKYAVIRNAVIVSGKAVVGTEEVKLYNRFGVDAPTDGAIYDIIGVTGYYNEPQFMPLSYTKVAEHQIQEIGTISEYVNLATGTEFKYTGTLTCVQNYVSGNHRYLYLVDETGGIIVYDPADETPQYETTDIVPGGWTAIKDTYKNLPEATDAEGFVEKTGNQNITPITMTVGEASTTNLLGAWVVIENVLIRQNTGKATTQDTEGLYITDGVDNLDIFAGHTDEFDLPEGWDGSDRFDVYGILSVYGDTRQILPTGIGQNGEIITDNIETIENSIKKVTYYNIQGISNEKPFDGLNIVVTEYNNGNKKINKQFYKF